MKNKKFRFWYFTLTPLIALFLVMDFLNISYGRAESIILGQKGNYCIDSLSNKTSTVDSEIMLYPGGVPIGVKIATKGVLVVAVSDVEGKNGMVTSPAAAGGVQIGDIIVEINNKEIENAEEVANEVNKNKTKSISLIIEREGKKLKKKIKPVKNKKDGNYKIGLWIRDSTAGVGTLTFYDHNTKKFGALGHPITDVDTGTILKIKEGKIIPSTIIDIKKGQKGNPGELRGMFVREDNKLGTVNSNTLCGIFGNASLNLQKYIEFNKPMPIALKKDIKEGPAQIITTLDGDKPTIYDIEIQKLLPQNEPDSKSMVIKITDKRLLEKTGGIVQGMSGSPIIQNGKIVGAVTHVLINKPDVGYGIYIEWMLKDAEILKNNK